MARVLLVFPPLWDPSAPYLSLPLLSGFLRRHGHTCFKVDLNLEFVRWLLAEEGIGRLAGRTDRALAGLESRPDLSRDELERYRSLLVGRAVADEALAGARAALRTFGDPDRFFSPADLRDAFDAVDRVAALVRAAYWPARFRLPDWNLEQGDSQVSSRRALALAADDEDNPFRPFLAEFVRRDLPADVDLLGLAVSYPQLVPALTLARLVRQSGHPARIVIGGGLVTKILPAVLARPELFDHVDAWVSGEGERPLLELAERCDARRPWRGIPGVFLGPGGSAPPLGSEPLALDEVATPDFDGLELGRYLSPHPVLPVASARGCYWDRCAFCARRRLYSGAFRARDSAAIVAELSLLGRRYGVDRFAFCDEAMSPRTLAECAALLASSDLRPRWGAWVRFEPGFDLATWRAAADQGFCYALAGMESHAAPILKRMRKGSSPRLIERQLADLVACGIHPALFVLFGFPGEDRSTSRDTIEFLLPRRSQVSLYDVHLFAMDLLSDVWLEGPRFGVSRAAPGDPEHDLTVYLPPGCYTLAATLDRGALAACRAALLGGMGQDLRLRQAMFQYAAAGRATELLPAAEPAAEGAARRVALGGQVRLTATRFALEGPRPGGRLSPARPVATLYRSGEVFALEGELAPVVRALGDGELSVAELDHRRRIAAGGRPADLSSEGFLRLGTALGIFDDVRPGGPSP